ncbi:MAG: MBL fold metallo-hydrolase [Firmicutes bacterium]|nr:MBL fold metallo-hydrolase [Bacillota bacterium]
MLLHVFGTCSGTEPYPGRHHTAFAFEHNERLYWFDAGEGCAYTAHRMGVDLLRLRKVVISHPHIDHAGGLANLLWTVGKLIRVQKRLPAHEIELLLPDMRIWDGAAFLCGMGDEIQRREYADGLLFDDEGFRVTALHNRHLAHEDGAPWRSFGFLIECEGRRVVYSGDTKGAEDYAALMDGCDLLLMETGHHHPPAVARELLERGIFPGKLAYLHHGRDFLDRYDEQVRALDMIVPGRYIILNDAMTLEV